MLLYRYQYSLQIKGMPTPVGRDGYFSSEAMFHDILSDLNNSAQWKVFVSGDDAETNKEPEVIMYDENYFAPNRCMVSQTVVGGQKEFYIDGAIEMPSFL